VPSCRSRLEEHRLERETPKAWTWPGPCRSMGHEAGAKWMSQEELVQVPSVVVEQGEA
jgi:hypothetical protein